MSRIGQHILVSLLPLAVALAACSSDTTMAIPMGEEGPDCDEEDTDADANAGDDFRLVEQLQLTTNRDVDVLFVVDNSRSMGAAQAKLAASMGSFVEQLEAVDANYRIGVTTTDNGNPWCPAGVTTPEAGKLVLSPCTGRLQDFDNESADVRDLACNELCALDEAALTISPTTTEVDANATPRPWVERIEGVSNLPADTDLGQALACFVPQGISGCGFESPLESMYLALIRAQNSGEASYGFLRAGAILSVVFVTDEADCSHNKDWSEIFDDGGSKVFWSDPLAPFPSSAVCWNAGVQCSGDPSAYTSCDSINKDIEGTLDASDADAVLHPMSRYLGILDGLEVDKQQLNPNQEVIVSLIAGLDAGSSGTLDWSVSYADVSASDPEFQNSFGIGPGCTNAEGTAAVPPARLRELSEAMAPANNMFSICESDFAPALTAIAGSIAEQIQPACFTKCVRDTDPCTDELEPGCTITQNIPGESSTFVPECLRAADGSYAIDPENEEPTIPTEDAEVCFAARTDADGTLTPDPADDMSPQCAEHNFNLEFQLVRRPGNAAPGGTSYSTDCYLADFPELSCPGIGG